MLDIAIGILESEGEVGVRVRQVADEAGVAIASLYHFFGNREGLVVAATIERYRRSQIGPIEEFVAGLDRVATREEWLASVRLYLTKLFDPAGAARRRERTILLGTALQRPALTPSFVQEQHRANQLIANMLYSARAKGFVRPDFDVDAYAVFYSGMILGRVLFEIDTERVSEAAWNEFFLDAVINALE